MKYVEKSGQNLGSILVKSNPWAGQICGRQHCLLCATKEKSGKNLSQNCSKRSITYQTWCDSCKQRYREAKSDKEKETVPLYTYIGESEKSAHKRGGEHTYDMKNLSMGSHMLKHAVDKHEGEDLKRGEYYP